MVNQMSLKVLLAMDYADAVTTALKSQGYEVTVVTNLTGIDPEKFDVSIVHAEVGVPLGRALVNGPAFSYCDKLGGSTRCYIIDPRSGELRGLSTWNVRGVLFQRNLAKNIAAGLFKESFLTGAKLPDQTVVQPVAAVVPQAQAKPEPAQPSPASPPVLICAHFDSVSPASGADKPPYQVPSPPAEPVKTGPVIVPDAPLPAAGLVWAADKQATMEHLPDEQRLAMKMGRRHINIFYGGASSASRVFSSLFIGTQPLDPEFPLPAVPQELQGLLGSLEKGGYSLVRVVAGGKSDFCSVAMFSGNLLAYQSSADKNVIVTVGWMR